MSKNNERGVFVSPRECTDFLEHIMACNLQAVQEGRLQDRIVPCIWGPAGISKTAVVKQFETRGIELKGEKVYPKVTHIALAQVEESGDISGLPITSTDATGEVITSYAAPEWWPTDEDTRARDKDGNPTGKVGSRPVILLFDDFNRADPRILKAIMQLLQDYRSNVHELPNNCHIMLTGNPPSDEEGTEYMVNEIDKAILTRMVHVSMKFSKDDWALWAQNNKVDSRVISFVLRYPELFNGLTGQRTNPRSVVMFARLIANIRDCKSEAPLVHKLANSCLDEEVATRFEKFVVGDMMKLVEPEEILGAWKTAEKKLESLKKRGKTTYRCEKCGTEFNDKVEKCSTEDCDGTIETVQSSKLRTDIIGIIADRMYVYLMQDGLKLDKKHYEGFLNFIQRSDLTPEDTVYTLLRRLRRDAKSPAQNQLFVDMIQYGGQKISQLIMSIT